MSVKANKTEIEALFQKLAKAHVDRDAEQPPGKGIEASRKVLDPSYEPSNSLIKRAIE